MRRRTECFADDVTGEAECYTTSRFKPSAANTAVGLGRRQF